MNYPQILLRITLARMEALSHYRFQIDKENSMDMDQLIRNLYSVVVVHGAVADAAIKAIEACLPYIADDLDRAAMAKAADILKDRLVLADDELWQALTRNRKYGRD